MPVIPEQLAATPEQRTWLEQLPDVVEVASCPPVIIEKNECASTFASHAQFGKLGQAPGLRVVEGSKAVLGRRHASVRHLGSIAMPASILDGRRTRAHRQGIGVEELSSNFFTLSYITIVERSASRR